jgi:hypothetical protein
MNISDKRFDDWKLVITSPAGAFAAVGPGGCVAIAKPTTGEVVWILPPGEMAAIIKTLEEINPQVLNSCLKWEGAKTQFTTKEVVP